MQRDKLTDTRTTGRAELKMCFGMLCDDVIEIRSTPTPQSVDADEEYELFFSIVSDDGFSQSGKNLDDIWNGILDQLELGNTFPGAAPRSTRPDVYKVTKIYFYRFYANF